jgi:hypothetical protein
MKNAAGYPNDADGDALRKVAATGADMGQPMVIEYSIAAPDELTAKRIAEVVCPRGYDPSIAHDAESNSWTVYCSRSMLVTYDGIVRAQRELNAWVKPYGGECDGWGTFGNG